MTFINPNANRPLPATPTGTTGLTQNQTGTDPGTGATVTHTPAQAGASPSPSPAQRFIVDNSNRARLKLDIGSNRTPIAEMKSKSLPQKSWTARRQSTTKSTHQRFLTRGSDDNTKSSPRTSSPRSKVYSELPGMAFDPPAQTAPSYLRENSNNAMVRETAVATAKENDNIAMIETFHGEIEFARVEHTNLEEAATPLIETLVGEVDVEVLETASIVPADEFNKQMDKEQNRKSEQ
jgi:hypothetical protein